MVTSEPELPAPIDGQMTPRRLRELLWRIVDERGDSCLREGVGLVRTVRIVAVLGGVAAVVAAIALGIWLLG